MHKFFPLLTILLVSFWVSGCSTMSKLNPFDEEEQKVVLQGERQSVISFQKDLEPDDVALEAEGFIAPEAWRNDFWPQAGGYPNHAMQNLALNSSKLKKAWTADIGEGAHKNLPLTTQPIIFNDKIYTMDADSKLSAFGISNGKKLWEKSLRPKTEDEAVIAGGMSYSSGRLYATSGYNHVYALNPDSGKVIWQVRLEAPARAAPTILDERVFVVTVNNHLLALNAEDGKILWDYQGLSEQAGLVGMASPAANKDIVVPVFTSGEMYALRVENGSVAWSETLSPLARSSGGLNSIADIRGMPIIDKGRVYAASYGGKMVALDERTGSRLWQREIGTSETIWAAGNHLFVLATGNEVAALGSDTGTIRWVTRLPKYADPKDKEGPLIFKGPVLAGGRLIVAGTEGRIIEIEPQNGKILREWSIGEDIIAAPVVASNALFLLTQDGKLHAFQ